MYAACAVRVPFDAHVVFVVLIQLCLISHHFGVELQLAGQRSRGVGIGTAFAAVQLMDADCRLRKLFQQSFKLTGCRAQNAEIDLISRRMYRHAVMILHILSQLSDVFCVKRAAAAPGTSATSTHVLYHTFFRFCSPRLDLLLKSRHMNDRPGNAIRHKAVKVNRQWIQTAEHFVVAEPEKLCGALVELRPHTGNGHSAAYGFTVSCFRRSKRWSE